MKPTRTRHPKKSLLQRVIFAITLVLIIAAAVFLLLVVFKIKPQNKSTQPTIRTAVTQKKSIKVDLPIRLVIPIIKVDTTINYVGLTTDGAMDIDKDPDRVAWYEFGPRPGDEGNAVIAGHYGWIGDKGAVFNELHTLKKGDLISVIDKKGVTINFIVSKSQKYDPEADATSVFKSIDGKSHLNLITCNGVWESSKNTYTERLVIFSDKEIQ